MNRIKFLEAHGPFDEGQILIKYWPNEVHEIWKASSLALAGYKTKYIKELLEKKIIEVIS